MLLMIKNRKSNSQENIRFIGFLIVIYSMITPIENIFLFFGAGTLSKYLAYLLFPILTLYIIKKKSLNHIKMSVLMILIVFFAMVSLLFASDQMHSIRGMITLFSLMAITILLVEFGLNSKEYGLLKTLNVYAMLFVAINMILGTNLVDASLGERVTFSSVIDHNVLATSMIIPFLIVMDGLVKKTIKRRALHYAILFVFFYSILLTGSRGGLLALLISTCVYILLASKRSFVSKMRTGAFIVIIGIFLVAGIEYLLPDALANRFTLNDVVSTGGTGRTSIWANYLDIFINSRFHNMILGNGYYSHGLIYKSYHGIIRGAHNDFITILIDLGISGIVLFGLFYFQVIKGAHKNKSFLGVSIIVALLVASLGVDLIFRKFYWNAILIAILDTSYMKIIKTNKTTSD